MMICAQGLTAKKVSEETAEPCFPSDSLALLEEVYNEPVPRPTGTSTEQGERTWIFLIFSLDGVLRHSAASILRKGMADVFLSPAAPHFPPHLLTDGRVSWHHTLPTSNLTLLWLAWHQESIQGGVGD